MIIFKIKDSVWINSKDSVTVYFSIYTEKLQISAYIKTPCGVPQFTTYKSFETIEELIQNFENLNQRDADIVFETIKNWKSNKILDLDYFQSVSHKTQLKT